MCSDKLGGAKTENGLTMANNFRMDPTDSKIPLVMHNLSRPIARIFRREITWVCDVYVYMHKHERLGGSGGMLPQEIRFSEIASEAIFGQKQSCSSYMARHFVCCINFVLAQSTYALPMPAEFEFPKVDRAAGGVTSQEGQLVNSRPPEVLFTHMLCTSFHRKFAME